MSTERFKLTWLAALMLLLLAVSPALGQTVLRVRRGAVGLNNGSSWFNAFPSLQSALSHAFDNIAHTTPVEIWVAGHPSDLNLATYKPELGVGPLRTFRKLRGNLKVIGGFAGSDATPTLRDPAQFVTILSGDLDSDGTPLNNAYSILSIGTLDQLPVPSLPVTLDGLIFEHGDASDTSSSGAAVDLYGSWPVIFTGCVFRDCRAGTPGFENGGGTVSVKDGGTVTFQSCRFERNLSNGEGGAVYLEGTGATVFTNCHFIDNQAKHGGAIYTRGRTNTLTGCVFSGNRAAGRGGAIDREIGPAITIIGSQFIDNATGVVGGFVTSPPSLRAEGGALYLGTNGGSIPSSDAISGCDFIGNRNLAGPGSATTPVNAGGGAIYATQANVKISTSRFIGNMSADPAITPALIPDSRGGAIRFIAGAQRKSLIDRCEFDQNNALASEGGAVMTYDYITSIVNSTFTRNTALRRGSAVFSEVSTGGTSQQPLLMAGCLVHSNGCASTGGGCTDANADGAVAAFGRPRIINCTIVNNRGSRCGGLLIVRIGGSQTPDPDIANSVLLNNTASVNPAPGGAPYAANFWTDPANPLYANVRNNCIGGGYLVSNNFTVSDPRFIDPDGPDNVLGTTDDDYRLALNSPLVDGGVESALPADETDTDSDGNAFEQLPRDLAGNARREDVPDAPDFGGGQQPNPDVGCYEAVPLVRQSFWDRPAGGVFHTPSNWRLGAAPTQSGAAVFDLGSAYTVTFNASTTIDSMRIGNDAVTLSLNGRTLFGTGGPTVLGGRAGDAASLVVNNGKVSFSSLRLADAPLSDAALTLSQASASMDVLGTLVIGSAGRGSVSLSGGAVGLALSTDVGDRVSSDGELRLSGVGTGFDSLLLTRVQHGAVHVENGATLFPGVLGALLLPEGRLTGDGTVLGSLTNYGLVRPGLEDAAARSDLGSDSTIGTLSVVGLYKQVGELPGSGSLGGGVLEIQLGAEGHDTLDVLGEAHLSGGLFVSFDGPFNPPTTPAYSAPILVADQVGRHVGGGVFADTSFSLALFPSLGDGRYFRVVNREANGRDEVRVEVAVLRSDAFSGPVTGYDIGGVPTDAALIDLDNDQYPDLVLTIPADPPGSGPGSVIVLRNAGRDASGWLGFDGAGQVTFNSGGVHPVAFASADFDADGRRDLLIAHRGSEDAVILRNTSTPAGIAFSMMPPTHLGAPLGGVVASDLDSDGDMDAAVTLQISPSEGRVVLLENPGTGPPLWPGLNPVHEPALVVGPGPTAIIAARLEGGGADPNGPDLVVAVAGDPVGDRSELAIFFNTGGPLSSARAAFVNPITWPVAPGPFRLLAANLMDDKDTDDLTAIITINAGRSGAQGGVAAQPGSISVVRVRPNPPGGQGGQTVLGAAVTLAFDAGTAPVAMAIANLDQDGDRDIAVVTRPVDARGASGSQLTYLRNDTPPTEDPFNTPLVFTRSIPVISPPPDSPVLVVAGDIDDDPNTTNDDDEDLVVINGQSLSAIAAGAPGSRALVIPNRSCVGDMNLDGAVNSFDLTFFLGRFGKPAPEGSLEARADLNGDAFVNTLDLTRFLSRFGRPCE